MRNTLLVRVPRETLDQAKGIAALLPRVSAGHVLAESLNLQLLMIATLDEMGHTDAEDGLNLTAHQLLSDYKKAILSQRLDASALSTRLALGIEAEVEARAHELAEAATPFHVKAALQLLGIPLRRDGRWWAQRREAESATPDRSMKRAVSPPVARAPGAPAPRGAIRPGRRATNWTPEGAAGG